MSIKQPKIWLSADQHLNHLNAIRYTNRPFDSVEEMTEVLMASYRNIVTPSDTVYWLGDFVFNRKIVPSYVKIAVARNLRTDKVVLVRGNHDRADFDEYQRAGIREIYDSLEIDLDGERILLVHEPIRVLQAEAQKRKISIQGLTFDDQIVRDLAESLPLRVLCGHVHRLFRRFGQFVNVGVDVWGYRPITLEEALGVFAEPSSLCGEVQHRREL